MVVSEVKDATGTRMSASYFDIELEFDDSQKQKRRGEKNLTTNVKTSVF